MWPRLHRSKPCWKRFGEPGARGSRLESFPPRRGRCPTAQGQTRGRAFWSSAGWASRARGGSQQPAHPWAICTSPLMQSPPILMPGSVLAGGAPQDSPTPSFSPWPSRRGSPAHSDECPQTHRGPFPSGPLTGESGRPMDSGVLASASGTARGTRSWVSKTREL